MFNQNFNLLFYIDHLFSKFFSSASESDLDLVFVESFLVALLILPSISSLLFSVPLFWVLSTFFLGDRFFLLVHLVFFIQHFVLFFIPDVIGRVLGFCFQHPFGFFLHYNIITFSFTSCINAFIFG